MRHYIKVRLKTNKKSSIILKLNKLNVDIKNINYTHDYLTFDILKNDIKRIKKYLANIDLEIIDETGIYKVKKEFKSNLSFFVSLVFGLIVFLILSNLIVKVNIIHENKDIRELINEDLKEFGVTPLSFKKSYDAYEKIIEDIKEKHKDKIEWLEIEVDGMVINKFSNIFIFMNNIRK